MEQQTAQPDANTGSSPAPVRPEALLDSLSSEERTSWEMTGEFPDRVTVGSTSDEHSADTSSAQPADQAAATAALDTTPASEPGKPAKEKGAKARTAELDAEIAEMRDRLRIRAALREELARSEPPQTKPAASSPAAEPTTAEYERFLAMPDAPKEENFDSYAKFTAAMGVFITDQRWQEHQTRQQAETSFHATVDTVRKTGEAAQARLTEFAKADPDFASKVNPGLLNVEPATMRRLRGEAIGPQHVLAEEIAKSEHVGPLLIHFSTPEGQQDWDRLMRNPSDLQRAFGRLEARFDSASASTPAPKYVSSAAAPPTVLGQRPADTSDPVDAAIKRKDPEAYAREQNKRELAAMGL